MKPILCTVETREKSKINCSKYVSTEVFIYVKKSKKFVKSVNLTGFFEILTTRKWFHISFPLIKDKDNSAFRIRLLDNRQYICVYLSKSY